MDFINEVDPTSLDGQTEKLSVEKSFLEEDMIDFESYIFGEDDEESDDYYLFQFGVGGPA